MTSPNRSASAATISHNRIAAIMVHITRYSFRGTSRLAHDAGVAKSTISHLIRGLGNPMYITARRVVKCLEHHLGRRLHPDEVFSPDGTYPTLSVCRLCGCHGCLPDCIFRDDGSRRTEHDDIVPGHWTGDVEEFQIASKTDEEVGTQ
ncbi:MAG: hypothetical protein M9921_10105 [Fimbriimonadaceae bacterium]|nr:hypothetical protein [Fimbriimonadaceae bacterium]